MSESTVTVKFTELKEVVSALELDAAKNDKGNAAAGVRLRKGLRLLKQKVSELVKTSVELDKSRK